METTALDYRKIQYQIVRRAVAVYQSSEEFAEELGHREGIYSPRSKPEKPPRPYSKESINHWVNADETATDVPAPVLMAICHMTGQSIDAFLGLADELNARIDEVNDILAEVEVAMGRRVQRKKRGRPRRGRST